MQDIIPATLLMSYVPASAIAIHHQLHGPCTVISTGCSAGADAIGQAFWAIQEGRVDRMLAGGSDSAINTTGLTVCSVTRALRTSHAKTQQARRAYDWQRNRFIMLDGAVVPLFE